MQFGRISCVLKPTSLEPQYPKLRFVWTCKQRIGLIYHVISTADCRYTL